jgi:hypothetical protein
LIAVLRLVPPSAWMLELPSVGETSADLLVMWLSLALPMTLLMVLPFVSLMVEPLVPLMVKPMMKLMLVRQLLELPTALMMAFPLIAVLWLVPPSGWMLERPSVGETSADLLVMQLAGWALSSIPRLQQNNRN